MRRRNILGFFAVSLVGGLIGRHAISGSLTITPEDRILDAFRKLTDPDAAAALCRDLPADARIGRDPAESALRLAASVHGRYDATDALRREVEERIRRDYGDGNIVILRGWTVAITEARLAALWRHA